MIDPNSFKQAILNQQRGFKRSISGRQIIDGLPTDGLFESHHQEAFLGDDGVITSIDERRTYRADCGDYLEADPAFAGRCKLGLFVCPHHLENCPRNYPLGAFEWERRPRITPCLKSCWLIINFRRLFYWLFTTPRGEEKEW